MTKKILALVALCAICLSLSLSAQALVFKPSAHFFTFKTKHFTIHYTKDVAPAAKDLADIAERVQARMTEKLKWKPWGRTTLILVDQDDQANGLTTVLPVNTILLHLTPPDADLSLDYYHNYLELLFTHEFTHVLHIDQHYKFANPPHWLFGKIIAPNGLTPGWMREGFAAWEETVETGFGRGNSSYADMVLRASILEDKFPHIDEVAGLGLAWPGSDSQYMYGVKFMQHLAEKYGDEKIQKYMAKYASGLWLFSLNSKAKTIFGESFYKLWKDWQVDLTEKYAFVKKQVEARGVTPFVPLVTSKKDQLSYPTPIPDGNGYAYIQKGNDNFPRIVIVDRKAKKPVVLKRGTWGQMAFSPDSQWLAFSGIGSVEKYTSYSDVYVYDRKSKTVRRLYEKDRLNHSMRANDPDFSPLDGGKRWLLMVRTEAGTDNLFVYDIKNQIGHYLTNAAPYTQFSNPRFSPDGKTIVVSRHDHDGNRDIALYTNTGTEISKITNDKALDNHPVWAAGGKSIYFDSDVTGIPNIFRYDLTNKKITQVSNVVTGVYQPALMTDGRDLLVRIYSAKGFDIAHVQLAPAQGKKIQPSHDISVLDSDTLETDGEVVAVTEPALEDSQSQIAGNAATPVGAEAVVGPQTSLDTLPEANQDSENIDQPSQADTQPVGAALTGEESSGMQALLTAPLPGSFDWAGVLAAQKSKDKQGSEDSAADKKAKPAVDEKDVTKKPAAVPSVYEPLIKDKPAPVHDHTLVPGSKPYSAFPDIFVPRYIVPAFTTIGNAVLFGAATGRFDPLYRHAWSAYADYQTDANFFSGGFGYSYLRFNPIISVGALRYVLNWGDQFGTGTNFFESRNQFYLSVTGVIHNRHTLSGGYFYELRDSISPIPAGNTLTMDQNAGFRFGYAYANLRAYPASSGPEKGFSFRSGLEITNSALGSSKINEREILTTDSRLYFPMPWHHHHVLALRMAGGLAVGDNEQLGGSFTFGGPFGEGNLALYNPRLFAFRGLPGVTFASDKALLFSGEYRFPLVMVERGPGTWPIFLNQLHMAAFTDYGNAWNDTKKDILSNFDNFFMSVGAELQADLTLGYGLPATARLGYGIIVLNESRVAGLTDALTGMDVKNGNLYFQFGISF